MNNVFHQTTTRRRCRSFRAATVFRPQRSPRRAISGAYSRRPKSEYSSLPVTRVWLSLPLAAVTDYQKSLGNT